MTNRASTDRREFLKGTAALAAWAALPSGCATHAPLPAARAGRSKKPAVIRGAFFYPRAEEVLAGKAEDSWSAHQWFTWPGNQFRPARTTSFRPSFFGRPRGHSTFIRSKTGMRSNAGSGPSTRTREWRRAVCCACRAS